MRTIVALLFVPLIAFADGERDSFRVPQDNAEISKADAQFDKRLPPVLPGEEVSDGKNKMKVWSSSGPVPVGRAPEPWAEPGKTRISPEVGVVIDQREALPRNGASSR